MPQSTRYVKPCGRILRSSGRWHVSDKLRLMEAIDRGELSMEQAARDYALSNEELESWRVQYEERGRDGLKTTKLPSFRVVLT